MTTGNIENIFLSSTGGKKKLFKNSLSFGCCRFICWRNSVSERERNAVPLAVLISLQVDGLPRQKSKPGGSKRSRHTHTHSERLATQRQEIQKKKKRKKERQTFTTRCR